MATLSGNSLFFGDNLAVIREYIADESVDLIYLDPPFNSNRSYNILFKEHDGEPADAQIHAFDDSWTWSFEAERTYNETIHSEKTPRKVADTIAAFRELLGTSDMFAYLVMMTPRLLELHRVLRATGSLYLHCDPTASHYLKIVLDAIFGPANFQNEVIWTYEIGGRSKKRWARKHDVILFYSKSARFYFDWTAVKVPRKANTHMRSSVDSEGREYQEKTDRKSGKVYRYYLDEGAIPPDFWLGIQQLNRKAAERLGYPTQKPLALLERIIEASSRPGDVLLDPFCGCGTAVDAAQKLDRKWIGIDCASPAIRIIEKRLFDQHGAGIENEYELLGIPRDLGGAKSLFDRDHFEFERWAVSLVHGQPNKKQRGDKGSDGVLRFNTSAGQHERIEISVKGGANNPGFVRDLAGTVQATRAAMGLMITLKKPTKGMREAAVAAGLWTDPRTGRSFPRVQIITIEELLAGKSVDIPTGIFAPESRDAGGKVSTTAAKSRARKAEAS